MDLKSIRISKGYTQEEASRFLSVPLRSYKRYENDNKYKSRNYYINLCQRLENSITHDKYSRVSKRVNITIAGIGYVGLSTAVVLSKRSNITLVDIDKNRVDLINNKKSPITSNDFVKEVKQAKLKATDSLDGYRNADIVIIATPTNLNQKTNTLNTNSVENVIKDLSKVNKNCLIIIKSTVPVGFTLSMINKYSREIVFCPEFLKEKSAIMDAYNPSRIIVGSIKKVLSSDFINLYKKSIHNCPEIIYMSPSEAEATKLFSNTYLAMRVAFFNELDSFALKKNLNIKNIVYGMGKDYRIGDVYNKPSIMFGGYCLPKDSKEVESEFSAITNNQIIKAINISNEKRLVYFEKQVIKQAIKLTKKNKKQIVIGIYNLDSQKINTDYRMSSSLRLLNLLKKDKIKVIVFDNVYKPSCSSLEEFADKSDLIVSNQFHKELNKYRSKLFSRCFI